MWKKILFLAVMVSFLSAGFCFAFDVNEHLPEIMEWWNTALSWIDNTAKPWLEANLGEETRQEFEREFAELINDLPSAIQDAWNAIKDLIN